MAHQHPILIQGLCNEGFKNSDGALASILIRSEKDMQMTCPRIDVLNNKGISEML